jgi:hypothetical protein
MQYVQNEEISNVKVGETYIKERSMCKMKKFQTLK